MTHNEAVAALDVLYRQGLRNVHDADLFVAYERDIPAIARLVRVGPHVPPDVRHLMFRDMAVWER